MQRFDRRFFLVDIGRSHGMDILSLLSGTFAAMSEKVRFSPVFDEFRLDPFRERSWGKSVCLYYMVPEVTVLGVF
jgi:hypothetical protein